PVSTLMRALKWAKRRPTVVALSAAVAVVALVGLGSVLWQWGEAVRQKRRAEHNLVVANAEKKAARYEEYRARLAAARAALQSHDVTSAEHQLELAPRELHGWEWDHLHSRLDDSFNVLRPATGERPSLLNTPQGIRVVWIAPNSLRVTDEQGSECAA